MDVLVLGGRPIREPVAWMGPFVMNTPDEIHLHGYDIERTAKPGHPARFRFEADAETELVVMVGEIGGDEEEKAADFIQSEMTKPVVAYIAGFTAPEGKTMGHAGAIVSGSSGARIGSGVSTRKVKSSDPDAKPRAA